MVDLNEVSHKFLYPRDINAATSCSTTRSWVDPLPAPMPIEVVMVFHQVLGTSINSTPETMCGHSLYEYRDEGASFCAIKPSLRTSHGSRLAVQII